MIKHGKTLLLAALLLPGAALAQFSVGDDIGTTETAVRTALEAQDYAISEIEIEDGNIEADVLKAGQSFEIEVSAETGLVLAFYEDDDDDTEDEEAEGNED